MSNSSLPPVDQTRNVPMSTASRTQFVLTRVQLVSSILGILAVIVTLGWPSLSWINNIDHKVSNVTGEAGRLETRVRALEVNRSDDRERLIRIESDQRHLVTGMEEIKQLIRNKP